MPDRRKDSGFTIIELAMVMSLLIGLLVLVFQLVITVLQDSRSTTERSEAVAQSRLALAQIDRQVRSGNVLFSPTADAMLIYTQSNGLRRCVQWQVVESEQILRTRSWATNWTSDPATLVSGWSTVGRNVVNDIANDGSTGAPQQPFVLLGGDTPYKSRLVKVRLFNQVSEKGGPPVEVSTSISGRNTNYGYDAGVCTTIPPA